MFIATHDYEFRHYIKTSHHSYTTYKINLFNSRVATVKNSDGYEFLAIVENDKEGIEVATSKWYKKEPDKPELTTIFSDEHFDISRLIDQKSLVKKCADIFFIIFSSLQSSLNIANPLMQKQGDSQELLIKGSSVNDDNKELKKRLEYVSKWGESIGKLYSEPMKTNNKAVVDSLDEVLDYIIKEKRKVITAFVKDYPHSILSAETIVENYSLNAEANEVEPLYKLLDKNIQSSPKGIAIKKMLDVYKTIAIGVVPPDFS